MVKIETKVKGGNNKRRKGVPSFAAAVDESDGDDEGDGEAEESDANEKEERRSGELVVTGFNMGNKRATKVFETFPSFSTILLKF